MSIYTGFIARWDAAGLNDSVSNIVRTHEDDFGAFPEDWADRALPRATVYFEDDTATTYTTSYRLRQSIARVTVWHSDPDLLETALNEIESLMDFSDRAVTSPMTITGGSLVNIQFSARNSFPEDEGVFRGYVEFELTWQKQLSTPS